MEEIGIKRKGDPIYELQSKRLKLKYEENCNFINYISEPPSLESIAIVSIATKLCTQLDLKKDLEQVSETIHYGDGKSRFQKLHDKVLGKLSEVCLPSSFRVRISNVIRPILLQLLRCFSVREEEYHQIYKFVLDEGFVCWTMKGTIDKVKSLKHNADTELICLRRLYYLACKYCAKECVLDLWNKLSDGEKNILSKVHHRYKFHIMAYWTAVVKDELPDFLSKIKPYDFYNIYDTNASINRNMVSLAVHCGNPLALKYFWYKLTDLERKSSVKRWFIALNENATLMCNSFLYLEYYERTEVLVFLLSHLNGPEEQKEMFQSFSMMVLKSLFFSWPFQKGFLPTITIMLEYLDEFSYVKIMSDIFNEIKVGRNTNVLFREVWNLSPFNLRMKLLNIFPSFWCIHRPVGKFLSVGDIETLLIIFSDATLDQQERVIFDVARDREALFDILLSDKLELLEELISKSLTKDDVNTFKKEINSNHTYFLFHSLSYKGAFSAAEKFLNWVLSEREIKSFKKTSIDPINFYYDLIKWGDYANFNLFMKWYFGTEHEANKFKRSIVHMIHSSCERVLLLSKLCGCGEEAWDRFEKFFNWSTSNLFTSRQISQFKKRFLKGVATVILLNNAHFATKLLNWCTDSDENVKRQFKNDLLLSSRVTSILVCEIYNKYVKWERLENIMKWFLPLETDVVLELKSLLNNTIPYKKNKLRAFYRLLDRIMEYTPECIPFEQPRHPPVADPFANDFVYEEESLGDYNLI